MTRDIAAARQLLEREHAALGAEELKRRLNWIKVRLLNALRCGAEEAEKSARNNPTRQGANNPLPYLCK